MSNQPAWLRFADSIEETQDNYVLDKELDDRRARVRCDLKAMFENDQYFLRSILTLYVDKLGLEVAPRSTL